MFSALLGMSVYLLRIWVLRIEFFGDVFPFVPRLGILPR